MTSKTISLQIRPRGKPIPKLPEEVNIPSGASASELYTNLARESRFSIHRLRITKGSDGTPIPNSKEVSINSTGLRDASTLYVKDLGPQIAWRTVFIVEYLGPLLIHPLVYAIRPYIYPSAPSEASQLQKLSCILITLHFLKRELETVFIHRFSAATMPARNIFRNSGHYWVLAGANIAAWIYASSSPTAKPANEIVLAAGLFLYGFGELWNFYAHVVLSNLRTPGTQERGIPKGFGFDMVTCPNYLAETISWMGVYLVSGLSWSVLLFAIVSTGQMMPWAKKKESRYRKDFGDKYKKKRYTMFPGIW